MAPERSTPTAPAAPRRWTEWTCAVTSWTDDPDALDAAAGQVRAVMARVEKAASRFLPDSEVHRLSDGRRHAVSPLLLDLLDLALGAAEATGGAVDPTIGDVMLDLGYRSAVPTGVVATDTEAPVRVRRSVSWRDIEIDHGSGMVQVPQGTVLDLGATAKAYAADLSVRTIVERLAVRRAVVGIGGDVAIGCPDGERLQVTVSERAGEPGVSVLVRSGGVATSSTVVRRWSTTDGPAHHVIDPATGRPAAGPWRTVTVNAATCTAANHAATAALVRGSGAAEWLGALGLPARLVDRTGRVVAVGGWPLDEEAAA